MKTHFRNLLVLFSALLSGCNAVSDNSIEQKFNYQTERAKHHTQLIETKVSIQGPVEKFALAKNVKEVWYESNGIQLKAYLVEPDKLIATKAAVVYLHGGFDLDASDIEAVQPFVKKGLTVLLPTLRGENGNAGRLEMFYGEVDDAEAAINWLKHQTNIDKKYIYSFGHSVGGGLSALLSLRDSSVIRFSGSSGGMYNPALFQSWVKFTPFDINDAKEVRLRLLQGNTQFMKSKHIAYIGLQDNVLSQWAKILEDEVSINHAPLTINYINGNHGSSLRPSMSLFAEEVMKDYCVETVILNCISYKLARKKELRELNTEIK